MGRKSKAIVVSEHKEIDKKLSDELREKRFEKLMRETKTERYKVCMKFIAEKYNPDDFGSIRDFAKGSRSLLMTLFIEICELEKERDEARLKLREYEEGGT